MAPRLKIVYADCPNCDAPGSTTDIVSTTMGSLSPPDHPHDPNRYVAWFKCRCGCEFNVKWKVPCNQCSYNRWDAEVIRG